MEPQPASLGLLHGNFQPLAPPDALEPLVVDHPTLGPEHRRDTAIAVAAIPTGQVDDRLPQGLLVNGNDRSTSLRRSRLSQIATGLALRDSEPLTGMGHTAPAALGA
tara:strand:- start:182 stop:502 length:321 start_codon:yes stop_codon:yes gene_type:complete